MVQYRFKQPSVEEQQQLYSLIYKKYLQRKRLFISGFVLILALAVIFLALRKDSPSISGALTEVFVPAPMPTEINANFINQVNKCFLPTAAVYGYTLRITSGFRSPEEQDDLYMQGRTINGHIVTEAPAGRSIHNYGYAVDVVDRLNGFDIDWDKLGRIGAYCGLEQGDEGDLPHFEHRGGLTTDQFKDGHRPADLTLPCPVMASRSDAQEKLTLADLHSCGAPNFNLDS